MEASQSGHRTVPMKVLCLGYSRTGTRSMREALLTLGFVHTYHTMDAAFIHTRDCKTWLQWLRAKHDGIGRIPGRADFDRLLGHCQAVCDMPAAYFAEELVQAYPDAKVILTIRDVDKWHKSVENTLEVVDTSYLWSMVGIFARLLRMPNRWNWRMFQKIHEILYDHDFPKNGRQSFEDHYNKVRSLVPSDRLLEYHVSEGWEPLCKFLDKPVPSEDTPFINQSAEINAKLSHMFWVNLKAQSKRLLDICAYTSLLWAVVAIVQTRSVWVEEASKQVTQLGSFRF